MRSLVRSSLAASDDATGIAAESVGTGAAGFVVDAMVTMGGGEVMITRAYKVPSALTYGTQIDPFAVEEFKSDFVVRVEVMKTWKFKYERGHETIWEPATIILYKIEMIPDLLPLYQEAIELAKKEAQRLDTMYPPGTSALADGER